MIRKSRNLALPWLFSCKYKQKIKTKWIAKKTTKVKIQLFSSFIL